MDTDACGDSGFECGGGSLLNCPSSGIYTPLSSLNEVNSFFTSNWDPRVSLAQNGETRASPMASQNHIDSSYISNILEYQGTCRASHLVQHPLDPSLVESVPDLPCFNKVYGTKRMLISQNGSNTCALFGEEQKISDEEAMEPSPCGKKKKRALDDESQLVQLKDMKTEDGCPEEQGEGKRKTEKNTFVNMHSKLIAEEVKDCSQNGEAPKENYIHVRARRGQATNSHSLAERVRRERINERMKFLQDLVPGCNKITGKAVMLDEIINYVQSLQRQVEFLSMKLATVYPEMKADIEQYLSEDIHHSQGGSAATPGKSSSYPISLVTLQGPLPVIHSSSLQSASKPLLPSVWDNELQSISQMGIYL